jgi:NAD(P)-dependent dehydrogenase (short-subunit alcohol dehydrogenase family)
MNPLREQLLHGREIALAGAVRGSVRTALAAAGAELHELSSDLDEDGAAEWARTRTPLHTLIYDGGAAFDGGGAEGLSAALERAWVAARAVATGAQIPGEAGGKIVLIAPAAGAGPFAEAARSGLENLARTLGVEWARYKITATAVAPGERTTGEQLATLVSFLASPAGDYFSGCRFDLGIV